MGKKFWIAFVAVFVVFEIMMFLVDGVLLSGAYRSVTFWRPDMMSLMWVYHVITLIGSFFFTFIFSKGFENKGIMEGVRYGFYIGVWLSVGMAYGTYAMIAIPYSLALQWFIYGVIEYMIAGAVLALVFKGGTPKAAA
jgi:hypothetical protein